MTITLILPDVSDEDVLALERMAASAGKTAEAMHLDILKSALEHQKKTTVRSTRRSFADVLCSMPNVGDDSDFDSRNANA